MRRAVQFREIRAMLARHPALRSICRAVRSGLWRLAEIWPCLTRDPNDPWRRYPFIDAAKNPGKLKAGNRYRPLTLQCETVNICNNLCIICAYPSQDREKAVMSMGVFEKVLADYSEMGGGYLSLTPVTGDVLLDKHLLERLDLVKSYPAIRKIGFTTNCAMLDRFSDDEVRSIVECLNRLQISIYGLDEEEYFAMTKRRTYDRMIDGVRRILAVRTKNVFLAFRLLKQRSPQDVYDWITNTVGCTAPVEVISIKFGEYANFSSLDTSKPLPFGASWAPASNYKKRPCLIPLLSLQVSSNGDVAFCSCVGALDDLVLGNIKNNTLLELYNSPKTRALWNWADSGVPQSCARCTHYNPIDAVRVNPSIIDDPYDIIGA